MLLWIILGGIMTPLGFYGKSQFSPVLFVEGMILLNYGILQFRSKKSIGRL